MQLVEKNNNNNNKFLYIHRVASFGLLNGLQSTQTSSPSSSIIVCDSWSPAVPYNHRPHYTSSTSELTAGICFHFQSLSFGPWNNVKGAILQL